MTWRYNEAAEALRMLAEFNATNMSRTLLLTSDADGWACIAEICCSQFCRYNGFDNPLAAVEAAIRGLEEHKGGE